MTKQFTALLTSALIVMSFTTKADAYGQPKVCCVTCTGINCAASLEGFWAFEESDGIHIAWVTAAEHNSVRFEVYGGEKSRLLAEVGAQGERDAHYYEFTTPFGRNFKLVEVDKSGMPSIVGTTVLAKAPANLPALRQLNDITAMVRSKPKERPVASSRAMLTPPVQVTDFVFYSSRQDLLDATLPIRNKLNAMGKSTQIILGSKWPESCKTAIQAIWERAVAYGNPLPFLVIVGNAYEDTSDPRNIVGTFYYPDTDGNCWFDGGCASDVKIVDFDNDNLPDIPWTRILGTNVTEITNSVNAGVYYYNNQKIKPRRVFILDGNKTASCGNSLEPRESLELIETQYQAKGIPTVMKHASDYAACANWAGKLADVTSIFQGGITEMIGMGLVTNRTALPGWIIQKIYSPVFSMSAVPYSQLFVAEFPGCELAGEDRLNPTYYPTIMQMFMTANPNSYATAVAWLGHKRGGWNADHIEFAKRYFTNRLAVYDNVTTLHHVYFNTIRELGLEQPAMRSYLLLCGAYGWPVQLSDMVPPSGGGGPCHGCPPPRVTTGTPPTVDTLEQNYPNPFNPATSISYGVASNAHVTLAIYNIEGKRIANLVSDQNQPAGWYQVEWNGLDSRGNAVASGVYFYRLTVADHVLTRKMVLIK